MKHADPADGSDREAALEARVASLERRLAAAEAERDSLRRAADPFFELVEQMPDAVMVHDRQWRILYLNPAGVAQFGLSSAAEAIGGTPERFIHPNWRTAIKDRFQEIERGEKLRFLVHRRLRPDGSTYFASSAAVAVDWNGTPACVVVIRDVTQQLFNAELVASVETRLRDAIESMTEGFAVFDRDDRLVEMNQRYRTEIFPRLGAWLAPGVHYDDIVRKVWEHAGARDAEEVADKVATARNSHRAGHGRNRIALPDGRVIRVVKRRTADGGTVGVYSDITEEQRRDDALREANERHRRVLDMLPDAVVIHCNGRFAYVNAAAVALFGAPDADALVGRSNFDFMPPEWQDVVRERMRYYVENGVPPAPQRQQRRRWDGGTIDVENHARMTTWNGEPAWIVVMRDISQRITAERELQETQRRLVAITANLPGAVYQRVLYPDGRIDFPYVSDGVRETHGFTAAEVLANPFLLVQSLHPEDRARYREALHASARDLTPFEMELRNHWPNGRAVWTHSVARPHRRDDGAVVWDGIFFDITAQKAAEERAALAHRWLLDAIECINEGFALWDRDDRLLLANRKYLDNQAVSAIPVGTGIKAEDFVRRRAPGVYGVDDEATAEAWIEMRMRHHREGREPFEVHDKKGRWTLISERRTPEGFTVGLYADITGRKRREKALQESEARYRGLVELMPDLVYVVVDGRFAFVNAAGARLLGAATSAELIDRPSAEFTHPDYIPEMRHRYGRVLNEGILVTPWECRRLRLDGSEFWTENVARQIVWQGRTASLVIARDITDQIAAKRALRDSEATLKALINASPDIAFLLDHKGMTLTANDAAARYFGTTIEAFVGSRARDFSRPDGREQRDAAIEHAIEKRAPVSLDQRRDGRWLHYTFCPVIDKKGRLQRVAIFIRDVTEARDAEENMRQAKETAEVANRSKSEFLANMSHELRTPLNAIIGFSEIMMTEMFGPLGNDNYKAYIRDVHESGTHLLQVINDILDLSKVEAGRLTPNLARVDPRVAIDSSIRIVKPRADSRGLRILTRIAPDVGAVEADDRILKQILMNLLSNSVKFTRGGGKIGVRASRGADGMVTIRVVDVGIGIAPSDMARVMQPFGQVDSTLSRKFQGTGLGLPLTRSLVALLDGTFVLWSKPDLGTVVTVRLPAWKERGGASGPQGDA
ncbi:MAG: PAS domain S-box protein [Rhodospirillaceae bacterium]